MPCTKHKRLYWHLVIGGFLQRPDRPHGCLRLFDDLGELRAPDTFVQLHTWRDDWKAVAEQIWLVSQIKGVDVEETVVTIAAYSWGAGWGAMRLAHYLGLRGIRVMVMDLSDPVYRHPSRLWTLLGLLSDREIEVPPTVDEVTYFTQDNQAPYGHRLVPAGGRTAIHGPYEIALLGHVYMDDLAQWHSAAKRAAKEAHAA